MKPASPIATTDVVGDHARLLTLWTAAGLPFKLTGRDSLEAFAAQQAMGLQTVLGIDADDGTLAGAVIATHDGRKGWINRLAVHPEYRRQGVGMRLIEAAEAVLSEAGITLTAAIIEPGNAASFATFMKAGYQDLPGAHYVTKRESKDA